jgi:hypothetical protein
MDLGAFAMATKPILFLYKFISSFFRQNASVRYWTGIGVLLVQFLVSGITFWKNYPKEAPAKVLTFSVQNSPIAKTFQPLNLSIKRHWLEFCMGTNGYLA